MESFNTTESDIKTQSAIVLIVDDNPTTAEFLMCALRPHYRTFSTFSGEDAIGFCVSHVPDLVILDLHMSGLDGLLTCKMLKAIPGMTTCPIIFSTSDTSTEQEIKCWDAGATDFVLKPFIVDSLLKRIESHIQTKLHSDALKNAAFIDPSTGLYNRRYFNDSIDKHVSLAQKNDGPLSLVLLKISYEQLFNDIQESKIQEQDFKLVAQLIARTLTRPTDILTRYSENELAILLPDTYIFGAKHIIQRMFSSFNELDDNVEASVLEKINIAIGMASVDPLKPQANINQQAQTNLTENSQSRNNLLTSYYVS